MDFVESFNKSKEQSGSTLSASTAPASTTSQQTVAAGDISSAQTAQLVSYMLS